MGGIVCIVGKSGSGKTRLISRIVAELSRRGWRVATAKHSEHKFSLEPKAKDTFKQRKSGAKTVLFLGPKETVVVRSTSEELASAAARYCPDGDILLAEGFAAEDYPKIAVLRGKKDKTRISSLSNLRAVVLQKQHPASPRNATTLPVPQFSPDNAKRICDFIEKEFLGEKHKLHTFLLVNGRKIPLKGFVQEFLGKSVLGMSASLKGAGKAEMVEVIVRRRN